MSKDIEKIGTPPFSLRERHRTEREEAILAVALTLMGENGYGAMTMDDLAARAGISKPTLYAYFPSKEAVAVRAVVRWMEEGCEFLQNLPESLPAFERIERAIRYMLTAKFVKRNAYLGAGRDALVPIVRANPGYQVVYTRLAGTLVTLFEEAKQHGTLKPELVTRVAVQAMISFLRDAEYIDLIERGDCEPQAVVDTLTTILLDGLRIKEMK